MHEAFTTLCQLVKNRCDRSPSLFLALVLTLAGQFAATASQLGANSTSNQLLIAVCFSCFNDLLDLTRDSVSFMMPGLCERKHFREKIQSGQVPLPIDINDQGEPTNNCVYVNNFSKQTLSRVITFAKPMCRAPSFPFNRFRI